MGFLDWSVLALFFAFTIWDGLRGSKGKGNVQHLLLAGRSQNWWLIGISVMATQASAITFIGTTGQAFMYDMRFIQVYLGLPLAMIVLSVTLVPFFHRLKVFTAYEALEQRFGLKARLLTSFLFLLSRGASLGITIAAPAYVLSLVMGMPFRYTILIIGLVATAYTMIGGIQAVMRTDFKQMVLMLAGLIFCFFWIINAYPEEVGFSEGLALAGALGKLQTIDFEFNLGEKYNLWSGLIAGFFLMLSYFGADQSQVQRYLTARSLTDARTSLLVSAVLKIPLQFFILLIGVNLYIFYLFQDRPLVFMPQEGETPSKYELQFQQLHQSRKEAALAFVQNPEQAKWKNKLRNYDQKSQNLRWQEIQNQETTFHKSRNDTNYVFPYFILQELPHGLIGLLVAAILAAALSSIDSSLNSLSASSVIDWYRRLKGGRASETEELRATYLATVFWGAFGTLSALMFGETDSIIELVNELGSYFYGPILGVFLLIWIPRASGRSAVLALILGLLMVLLAGSWQIHCDTGESHFFIPLGKHHPDFRSGIEYLWLNPIGLGMTVLFGWALGSNRAIDGEATKIMQNTTH